MPRAAARAPHVPPRSTITRMATGSAPKAWTTSTASMIEVPRVTVSSVITTLSPGSRAPARRPVTPWSLASLRTLKLRSGLPAGGRDRGDPEGHGVGAHRPARRWRSPRSG